MKENEIVRCVKCFVCGTLHEANSEDYFRIVGDVYVGESGGIIGGNQPERFEDVPSFICCRELICLSKAFNLELTLKR